MYCPLAIEPQLPGRTRRARKRQRLLETQKRAVDRMQARRARRRQHNLLVVQPPLDMALSSPAPERGRQIRIAEDQRAQSWCRHRDLLDCLDPRWRLDQRLQPDLLIERRRDSEQRLRRLHLWYDHRQKLESLKRPDQLEIRRVLRRRRRIDPHRHRSLLPLSLCERCRNRFPCILLSRPRNGILEVEHDLVRRNRDRLLMHPHRVTGNRQARTAQWQRAAINDGGHDREDNQPVAQASSARVNEGSRTSLGFGRLLAPTSRAGSTSTPKINKTRSRPTSRRRAGLPTPARKPSLTITTSTGR